MIKEILMQGIKGQNTAQELTGRDIITGRNGAGKTTRMQALTLAMLGYVPGMDKTNAAVFGLSSDPKEMSVGLVTDDLEFNRIYMKKEKLNDDGSKNTSFSQKIILSPSEGETTNTQKENRIKSVLGNFPVMLDFNAFISMTDMQKRDFIYSLSGQTDIWDREYIISRIKDELLTETLRDNNSDMYEIMEENIDNVVSCYGKTLDMNKGILAMVEQAKTQKNYWTQKKADADGAARKLAEMKNRARNTDRDLNDNLRLKAQLDKEKEELVAKIATYEAQNRQFKLNQVQIAELEEKLEAVENLNVEYTLKMLRADIQENPYIQEIEELEEQLTRWKAEAGQYDHLLEEKAEIEAGITVTRKMIRDLERNTGKCAINPNIPCGQDFTQYINSYEADLTEWYNKKMDLDEHIEKFETLKEFIITAQDKQDRAIHAKNRIEKENAAIQEEINKLMASNPVETAAIYREQIEKLRKQMKDEPFAEMEPYTLQLNELNQKIMDVAAKIEEQQKIRTTLTSIRDNMMDSDEASYQMLTWKKIVEVLGQKGIQGEIVKQMLDPISDAVSEKLRGMQDDYGHAPKEFFFRTENENGKESFQFGWISDRGEIPFDALSQGEQMLLLTALMVVIIEKNNPPIKILAIDNVNHLDQSNVQRIVTGLQRIGASMDNIILAGVINTEKLDAAGWHITEI